MVLKEDVEKLGYRGDEVSVKAGYARNFLYPQKLAVYATDANRVKFKVNRESLNEVDAEKDRALKQIVQKLSTSSIYFKRHTSSKTDLTLHTCVTAQEISDCIEKQLGLIVGVARVQLPTPLKTLGTHTVNIRVDDEVEKEVASMEAAVAAASTTEVYSTTEVDSTPEEQYKTPKSKQVLVELEVQVVRR